AGGSGSGRPSGGGVLTSWRSEASRLPFGSALDASEVSSSSASLRPLHARGATAKATPAEVTTARSAARARGPRWPGRCGAREGTGIGDGTKPTPRGGSGRRGHDGDGGDAREALRRREGVER